MRQRQKQHKRDYQRHLLNTGNIRKSEKTREMAPPTSFLLYLCHFSTVCSLCLQYLWHSRDGAPCTIFKLSLSFSHYLLFFSIFTLRIYALKRCYRFLISFIASLFNSLIKNLNRIYLIFNFIYILYIFYMCKFLYFYIYIYIYFIYVL